MRGVQTHTVRTGHTRQSNMCTCTHIHIHTYTSKMCLNSKRYSEAKGKKTYDEMGGEDTYIP